MNLNEIEKMQELLYQQMTLLEKQKDAALLEEFNGKVILGFKLSRDKLGTWRAFKRINGKNHVPHIGKNPKKARQKIRDYIEKNGLHV